MDMKIVMCHQEFHDIFQKVSTYNGSAFVYIISTIQEKCHDVDVNLKDKLFLEQNKKISKALKKKKFHCEYN
jgi:hypothetical protein